MKTIFIKMFKIIKKQTAIGWGVGVVFGALFHFIFSSWVLGLFLTLCMRVGIDLLYAFHDVRKPPSKEESMLVKPDVKEE